MAFIRVLIVAGIIAVVGGCDSEDCDCQQGNGSGCTHLVGLGYDNEKNCAYPTPVYIGCYEESQLVAGGGPCYISPEKNVIVILGDTGLLGEILLDEGWTVGCDGFTWCETW